MRDMVGGSYTRALTTTFIPELTSMNCLMAGMAIVSMIGKANVAGGAHPSSPSFWFIMSMALLIGLCAAYPMNYWLVSKKLKHGMTTVRPKTATPAMAGMAVGTAAAGDMATMPGMAAMPNMPAMPNMESKPMDMTPKVTSTTIALVVALSFVVLIIGVSIGLSFA